MKLREACRLLGIPVTASLEDAENAFRMLSGQASRELGEDDPARAAEAARKEKLLREAIEAVRRESGGPAAQSHLYDQIYGARKRKKEAPSSAQSDSPSLLEETFSRYGAGPSKWLVAAIAGAFVLGLLLLLLLAPGAPPPLDDQPEAEAEAVIRMDSEVDLSAEAEADPPPEEALVSEARATTAEENGAQTAAVERQTRPPRPAQGARDAPRLVRDEIDRAAPAPAQPAEAPAQAAGVQGSSPDSSGDQTDEAPAPVEMDLEAEIAFRLLKDRAEAALRLHEGLLEEFDFLQWSVVSRSGSNWMIDLSARNRETGRQEHFVWSVDTERERVRALSQAARDLEGRFQRSP